ncbi:TPA: hypothetical protein WIZ28_000657 [Neisseria meningitidis]
MQTEQGLLLMPSESRFRRHFVLPCAARIIGAFCRAGSPKDKDYRYANHTYHSRTVRVA